MADVLAKVRGLLELAATNANVDEARNAALQAARLIKKHGLAIGTRVAEGVADAVVEEVRRAAPPSEAGTRTRERAEPPASRTRKTRRDEVVDATVEAAGRVASRVAKDVARDALHDLFGFRR